MHYVMKPFFGYRCVVYSLQESKLAVDLLHT